MGLCMSKKKKKRTMASKSEPTDVQTLGHKEQNVNGSPAPSNQTIHVNSFTQLVAWSLMNGNSAVTFPWSDATVHRNLNDTEVKIELRFGKFVAEGRGPTIAKALENGSSKLLVMLKNKKKKYLKEPVQSVDVENSPSTTTTNTPMIPIESSATDEIQREVNPKSEEAVFDRQTFSNDEKLLNVSEESTTEISRPVTDVSRVRENRNRQIACTDPVKLLNKLCIARGWSRPAFDNTVAVNKTAYGVRHLHEVNCIVSNDQQTFWADGFASSKKKATRLAATKIYDEIMESQKSQDVVREEQNGSPAYVQSIGRLRSLCMKNRWSPPQFEVNVVTMNTTNGLRHRHEVNCIVTNDQKTFWADGFASRKRDAMRIAAATIYEEITGGC